MHRGILVKRRAIAMDSIVKSANTIIERAGMDTSLILRLQSSNVQDSAVADLFRLEALAEILLAIAAGHPIEQVIENSQELADEKYDEALADEALANEEPVEGFLVKPSSRKKK